MPYELQKTPTTDCPVLLSVTANGCNLSSARPNKTHNLCLQGTAGTQMLSNCMSSLQVPLPPDPCAPTVCPKLHNRQKVTCQEMSEKSDVCVCVYVGVCGCARVCVGVWLTAGFRRGVYEIFPLPDLTQRRFIVGYRRFGTTCRSHFQMSSSPNTRLRVPKRPLQTTNPRCPTSQKSEHLESDE